MLDGVKSYGIKKQNKGCWGRHKCNFRQQVRAGIIEQVTFGQRLKERRQPFVYLGEEHFRKKKKGEIQWEPAWFAQRTVKRTV